MNQETDKYGNREGELKYCCFPDCGCDGARLCMAEEGPSRGSQQLNLEKRTVTTPVYEANPNKRK